MLFPQIEGIFMKGVRNKEMIGTANLIGYELFLDEERKGTHGKISFHLLLHLIFLISLTLVGKGTHSLPISHQQQLYKTSWISVYRQRSKCLKDFFDNKSTKCGFAFANDPYLEYKKFFPGNLSSGALRGVNLAQYLLKSVLYATPPAAETTRQGSSRVFYVGT